MIVSAMDSMDEYYDFSGSESESYESLFAEIDAYDGNKDYSPSRDAAQSLTTYDWGPHFWPKESSYWGDVGSSDLYTSGDNDELYIMNKDDMSNAARVKRTHPTSSRPLDPNAPPSDNLENQESGFHEAYEHASESLQHQGEHRLLGADERLIFQAALQDLNQPKTEVKLPEGLLSVPLLRHQNIALAWMIQRETCQNCPGGLLADDQGLGKTISMIAIIQMHKSLQDRFRSDAFRSIQSEDFDSEDDESDPLDKKKQKMSDELEIISKKRASSCNRKPAAGTLVVCPASVLRQWDRELDEKVTRKAKLSVLLYHGSNRTRSAYELAKYDVVLTTYSIVTNEVPKQPLDAEEEQINRNGWSTMGYSAVKNGGKRGFGDDVYAHRSGALAKVRWFRVILDEAQTIKNHRTLIARACCSLRAKKRWCLSGTPIQNSIDELFSYFRFLKYEPYCKYRAFFDSIKFPISAFAKDSYKKLQVVLKVIMLRRTKGTLIDGQPIVSIPPKEIQLTKVEFSTKERDFYNKLEAHSRAQFKAFADAGTVNQNYANLLLMLLRLRQACNHPLLVKGFTSTSVEKESFGNTKSLSKDKLSSLLKLLDTSMTTCSECNDLPEDPVVSVCGHVFCFQCVSDYLTGDESTCPVPKCKRELSADVVFSKKALKKHLFGDDSSNSSSSFSFAEKSELLRKDYCSSKIRAALKVLRACCDPSLDAEMNSKGSRNGESSSSGGYFSESDTSKPIKALVFSQWTGMLDLFEAAMKRDGLIYRRFDGSMSLASRDRAIKEFNTNPKVRVMLMSLKAGNLGLNMVAACRVILLDLWWNPTAEDQAIDRAHRIGQTRPVIVSRLTIKDTVEDRILALQDEKRKMVASAFGEDQTGAIGARLNVNDLRHLFGA